MKKTISGKTYDTEKAIMIDQVVLRDGLFQTKGGDFFVAVGGDVAESIQPVDIAGAVAWLASLRVTGHASRVFSRADQKNDCARG